MKHNLNKIRNSCVMTNAEDYHNTSNIFTNGLALNFFCVTALGNNRNTYSCEMPLRHIRIRYETGSFIKISLITATFGMGKQFINIVFTNDCLAHTKIESREVLPGYIANSYHATCHYQPFPPTPMLITINKHAPAKTLIHIVSPIFFFDLLRPTIMW